MSGLRSISADMALNSALPVAGCSDPGPVPASGDAPGDVTLEVACGFGDLRVPEGVWDETVERLGGPVYMTHCWLSTWWEFYGAGLELRLCVFRRGEVVVGLLPMYLEDFGWGPLRTRVARLLGASLPPKTFDPPVDAQAAPSVFRLLVERLFQVDGCDVISLGPVSADWVPSGAMQAAADEWGRTADRPVFRPCDVHTVFQLPDTFEAYLAGLGSSERKNRMKRVRQLEKQYRIATDIIAEPEAVGRAFEEFAALHGEQWRRVGKGGHFEAWPRALEYNRVLTGRMAERGRVRFFRLLADERVISSRYTFIFGPMLYSELPARAVGEPWDRLGIGGSSLLKFNEALIAAGHRNVDSGLGEYDHKSHLGGERIPVGIWRIVRASEGSRRKVGGLLLVGKLVTLACQKIWYRRVAARLPWRLGRSQKRFWLKFAL